MRTTAKMGLTSWDQATDPYNYAQLAGNWQLLDYHDHTPGHGTPIGAGGLAPGAVLGLNVAAQEIGPEHLSGALIGNLGLVGGGSTGRGYWSKPGVDTTSSGTFVDLGDKVSGIVVKTGGLIEVGYNARAKVTAGTGAADIFIDTHALTTPAADGVPTSNPVTISGTFLSPVLSKSVGLVAFNSTTADSSDTTFGQVIGPFVRIFLAPGTYDVGVRYSASGGTLSVQNRQLWVLTQNFQ